MDAQMSRLQIAAKIHFFLKRELGTGIDVETMLKRPSYAGEVLAMCDKARGTELAELAQRFRSATAEAERTARQRVPQPWADDTSGFGLSKPWLGDEDDDQAASAKPAPGRP
jgi:hypothetical protein